MIYTSLHAWAVSAARGSDFVAFVRRTSGLRTCLQTVVAVMGIVAADKVKIRRKLASMVQLLFCGEVHQRVHCSLESLLSVLAGFYLRSVFQYSNPRSFVSPAM